MELQCQVQKYDWGKIGNSSTVAKLVKTQLEIEETSPYAELWMGTHVNGPSMVKSNGNPLSQLIKENPEFIGKSVREIFGDDLPYLFKILSVNKALSIQAHPDKKLAEELHAKFPSVYKDPNHKPELAIALTPFEALCGFRPIKEIRNFVTTIPELNRIVGAEILNVPDDVQFLKFSFASLFQLSKDSLEKEAQSLIERFSTLSEQDRESQLAPLIEVLNGQFPSDVGLFVVYFLNYVKLQPGEAIYLGASKPHAYLSGDCVECMACSDNVVRAGFTPKFIDVETLVSMLIYEGENPSDILFKPTKEDGNTQIYRPPVPDFAVAQIKISAGQSYATIPRDSGSIIIVIGGSGSVSGGSTIQNGSVLFVPANVSLQITSSEDLIMYQGLANV